MTSQFVDFIDITGGDASRAPFVKGGLRAYYATGSMGIEETAAQVAAARAAGMGILLIDQTPSLSVFAAGIADVADIENYAGTPQAAANAVAARQAREQPSDLYSSYSLLATVKGRIARPAGVSYYVADYSWSREQAMALLDANADWSSIQYGDPNSNGSTLVPGTSVTLREANADVDIAKASWAARFLSKVAPPPPAPAPNPHPRQNPDTPLIVNGMFGTKTVKAQQWIDFAGNEADCDGSFGPLSKVAMQKHLGVTPDGVVGPVTVEALQRHVGSRPDGLWGPFTTEALQKALNADTY